MVKATNQRRAKGYHKQEADFAVWFDDGFLATGKGLGDPDGWEGMILSSQETKSLYEAMKKYYENQSD